MLPAAFALAAAQPTLNIRNFGAVGNGRAMCTQAIQRSIDQAAQVKGTVEIPRGRYLTGSLHLRSDITLKLDRGAVILGSTHRKDYDQAHFYAPNNAYWHALIIGQDVSNVVITGEGKIDGQGAALAKDVGHLIDTGEIKLAKKPWRPPETERPQLIEIDNGANIKVQGITLANSSCWVEQYVNCVNMEIKGVHIRSMSYWNNDGIDLVDCQNVHMTDCDINSADDGICLKSDDPSRSCQNIAIDHCRIRSSASAIKFGTASHGGFNNIAIKDIEVHDTFRSAVALESVDGAELSNVAIVGVHAVNTGNAFFIRLGRRSGQNPGSVHNIVLKDFDVQIPSGAPDRHYRFRGPAVSEPQNLAPASIVGLPEAKVSDIAIENIRIRVAGGINQHVKQRKIQDVPERPKDYPEFSMFGELPAWALYLRHIEGITIHGFTATLNGPDYRPPFVLDDVKGVEIEQAVPSGSPSQPAMVLHNVSQEKLPRDLNVQIAAR